MSVFRVFHQHFSHEMNVLSSHVFLMPCLTGLPLDDCSILSMMGYLTLCLHMREHMSEAS